jgi:hypothetical protein
MAEAMGTRVLTGLDQDLEEAAGSLLRTGQVNGMLEAIYEYAMPLTFRVVRRVFAVDRDAGDPLESMTGALGGGFFSALVPPGRCVDPEALPPLSRLLLGMVRDGREDRADTLAARLVAAAPGTPEPDLINLLLIVLFASHHNMIGFLGNAILALAADPEAAAAAAGHGPLPPAAVLELLRFDPPLQFLALTARKTLELHGHTIAIGEPILLAIGAANRDPDAWPDPDRLDLSRDTSQQLSFGAGAWRCLGARLAQAVAGVALGRLLAAVGVPRLAEPPVWRLNGPFVQRGPRSVRIALDQAGRR